MGYVGYVIGWDGGCVRFVGQKVVWVKTLCGLSEWNGL